MGLDGPVYVGSEVASRLSFSSLLDLLPGADATESNASVARARSFHPLPPTNTYCPATPPRPSVTDGRYLGRRQIGLDWTEENAGLRDAGAP